jgi:hypothetical protein
VTGRHAHRYMGKKTWHREDETKGDAVDINEDR